MLYILEEFHVSDTYTFRINFGVLIEIRAEPLRNKNEDLPDFTNLIAFFKWCCFCN